MSERSESRYGASGAARGGAAECRTRVIARRIIEAAPGKREPAKLRTTALFAFDTDGAMRTTHPISGCLIISRLAQRFTYCGVSKCRPRAKSGSG